MNHQLFHHKERFHAAGNTHSESVLRTMTSQSLDHWDMFTRETLQNSWDARDETSTDDGVTFAVDYTEFDASQVRMLRDQVFGNNFDGINSLKDACSQPLLPAIIVSDSGTKGLGGPTKASVVTNKTQDFVSFVRNVGRSNSKSIGGGTYGFGKSVYFVTSKVNTIVIYSRTLDEYERPVSRLIAMANSAAFNDSRNNYTGRHWWGLKSIDVVGENSSTYAEPFEGAAADKIAHVLGLDKHFSGLRDRGTSIAVLAPNIEDDPKKEIQQIANALTRWAWPHMIDEIDTGLDPIDFHVTCLGKKVAIPDPDKDPALTQFIYAYKLASLRTPATLNEWEQFPGGMTMQVATKSPRKALGTLAMVSIPQGSVPAEDTVIDKTIDTHIATLRKPRMVVQYYAGPTNESNLPYCGVFIANDEADPVFARSEPAAHHQWNYETIQNDPIVEQFFGKKSRSNPVRIFFDRLSESLRGFNAGGSVKSAVKHQAALSTISKNLGMQLSTSFAGKSNRVGKASNAKPKPAAKRLKTTAPKVEVERLYRKGSNTVSIFRISGNTANVFEALDVSLFIKAAGKSLTTDEARSLGLKLPVVLSWSAQPPEYHEIDFNSGTSNAVAIPRSEVTYPIFVTVKQPESTAIEVKVSERKAGNNE